MKTKSVQTAAVMFAICALVLTACGSKSNSSTASASSAGSTTTAAASSSSGKASTKCISASDVESNLLIEVKDPTSTTSGDTTTCNYPASTSQFGDGPVTITYTDNATAATLAAAKAKAISDGFANTTDNVDIGEGSFQGSKADGSERLEIDGGLHAGTLEVLTSHSGSAEQAAYLQKVFGELDQ